MNTTGKILFWTGVATVAGIGGYLIYKNFIKSDIVKDSDGKPALDPTLSSVPPFGSPEIKGDKFPLTLGSKGDNVIRLQADMKKVGVDVGKIDGIFGPKTLSAVQKTWTMKDKMSVKEQDIKNLEYKILQAGIPQSVKDIYGLFV